MLTSESTLWKFLEWRYLPLLLIMALSAGVTVGFFAYVPSDTKVQLAPELSRASHLDSAQPMQPLRSSTVAGSQESEEVSVSQMEQNSTTFKSLPATALPNSYQVAVADPVGIRLKTIVSR